MMNSAIRVLFAVLLLGPALCWEDYTGYRKHFKDDTYVDQGCGSLHEKCCDGHVCDKGGICQDGKCVECGIEYGTCCEGHKCKRGLACDDEGKCQACGLNAGDLCCPGGLCDKHLTCTFQDVCAVCGGHGEQCCEDHKCKQGFACHENMCVPCGRENDQCCQGEGKECLSGDGLPSLKCIADTCVACGGEDQPCCPHGGKQCMSPEGYGNLSPQLACIAGSCVRCGGPHEPCCEGPGKQCESPKGASYERHLLDTSEYGYEETELICAAGTCIPCGGHEEPCCEGTGSQCLPSYDPCAYDGYEAFCAYRKSGVDGYVDPSLTCVTGKCVSCGGYGEPCCGGEGTECLPSYDPCDYGERSEECYKRKLLKEEGVHGNYVGFLPVDDHARRPLTCVTGSCIPCGGYGEPCCEGEGDSCPETYTIEKYAGYRALDEEEEEELAKFEIHEVPLSCVAGTCEVCGVKGYPCCDVGTFGSFSNVGVDKTQLANTYGAGLVIGTSACLFPSVCESGSCTI